MSGYSPEGLDDAFTAGDGSGSPAARGDAPALPSLGPVGWLRWTWRQLTSMRVALLLLMLLAVAAVPGSVFPQRAQDTGKVAAYLADHRTIGPWMDRLQLFTVYSSVWFSAIYLLLFISLVGCILPRARAHLRALRARPPRVPRSFGRFPAQGGLTTASTPTQVADAVASVLRGRWRRLPRFRVDVTALDDGGVTISAERGYLRETGNLVFHLALVGLLISVATGQMLHYRGQAIVVQGRGFANAVVDYDTFENGAAFDPASLVPFTLTLDAFTARFDPATLHPRDFRADVTVTQPDGSASKEQIKVNHPLRAGGANVYLQGNGYAPDVVVHDADGNVAFSGPTPFLPQNAVYTSLGVIKVPDVTSGEQIGLRAALLPTAQEVSTGVWQSVDPQPINPLLVLTVFTGNLGLDEGVPQNVYKLDTTHLTQVQRSDGTAVTLYVKPGETVDLPNGLGTVTFQGLPRYVALDLRHDPALAPVLVFALLALAGLATSLFTPRRRIWLRALPGKGGLTVVTAAALARGDDIGLQAELDRALAVLTPDHAEPETTQPEDER